MVIHQKGIRKNEFTSSSSKTSAMSMFSFSSLDACLRFEMLRLDMNLIITLSNNHEDSGDICKISHEFVMRIGIYPDSLTMYSDVERVIRDVGCQEDILELMPLIDDYIALFF